MKVSDLPAKAPHICMYGEVGAGKTGLALTCGARAQVIDLDNGLMTAMHLKDKFTEARQSVDVKQFLEEDPQKKITAFAKTKAYIYDLPAAIKRGQWDFDVFIMDSLSTMADSAVATIMANSNMIGKAPQIQHWGMAFTEIQNVLNVVRTLPCVVILIAHEQVKMVGKPPNDDARIEIAIPGKNLPSKVARYYDELWWFKNSPAGGGNVKRTVQTVSNGLVAARSRGCLPNLTNIDCGMWELLKKIGYEPPKPQAN